MANAALDKRFREVMASNDVWAGLDETADKVPSPNLTDEEKTFIITLYEDAKTNGRRRPSAETGNLLWVTEST